MVSFVLVQVLVFFVFILVFRFQGVEDDQGFCLEVFYRGEVIDIIAVIIVVELIIFVVYF